MEEEKDIITLTKEDVESTLKGLREEGGITPDNVEIYGELIDMHKDLCNEDYWKEKKEFMRYRYNSPMYRGGDGNEYGDDYGRNYGARQRDSRGRYTARGVDSKYRGDYYMDDMYSAYHDYAENSSRYGADINTMESLKEMLSSVEDFMKHLEENASSQEEVEMIKRTARKISDM